MAKRNGKTEARSSQSRAARVVRQRSRGKHEDVPMPDPRWALFLDVDGSLLDIAATPHGVAVPAELRGILIDLTNALDGAVALVSGRAMREVDRLLAPLRLPVAGQHGAEIRLPEGGERAMPACPALDPLRRRLNEAAVEHPGLIIEDKGASITAHYRLAPDRADLLRAVLERELRAIDADYHLLESKMAFDVKPRRFDKGTAVVEFMGRWPFSGRIPVFIGDDATDRDGFAAVLALGGIAIQIGPRPAGAGVHYIASPRVLRAWLAALPAAIAARHPAPAATT